MGATDLPATTTMVEPVSDWGTPRETPPDPTTPLLLDVPTPPTHRKAPSVSELPDGLQLTLENMEGLQEAEEHYYDTTKLRAVFEGMATNGRITVDQLPFVLVGGEVNATAKEIEDTIDEMIPDADDVDALLDFQQVEALFQQLMQNAAENLDEMDVAAQAATRLPLWQRVVQWWRLKQQQRRLKQTAYEKHMRPTTRLLLVILATATAISLGIVLFAIIFIFNHSISMVEDHLLRNVVLVRDGINLFANEKPRERYADEMQQLASLLGVVVEDLGFEGSKDTLKQDLAYQQKLVGRLLDGWFAHEMTSRATINARLMKGWVSLLAETEGKSNAVDFVNNLNPTLPDGHEIVLSEVNTTTHTPQYLSTFRYRSECENPNCGHDGHFGAPTLAALTNQTSGTIFGPDYRPRQVVAGFTYLPVQALGLVYQMERAIVRDEFDDPVSAVVNQINAVAAQTVSVVTGLSDTHEVVLAKLTPQGRTQILTTQRTCGLDCMKTANFDRSVLAQALNGTTAVVDTRELSGAKVIEAFGPLPLSGLGVAVKIQNSDFLAGLYGNLGEALDLVNAKFNGTTQEVQLAVPDNRTVTGLKFLTKFKYPQDCVGACDGQAGDSAYLARAARTFGDGVVTDGVDYRQAAVTAGYSYVPSLNASLAMKIDNNEIYQDGIRLVHNIMAYETDVRFASSTYEFVAGKKKPGVTVVHDARDYNRINTLKLRRDCPNMTCTGPSTHMVRALSGETGVLRGPDYRGREVYGAFAYVSCFDIGLVVKVDTPEAEADSIAAALQLAGCCVGALVLSMLLLAFWTSKQLRAMDEAWDEGKRAIEREKQQFRGVIEAMYPEQVAKRLLAGETDIVYHVASATVFFSDIYEFTTASNSITPEELIQFMGYTFGTMDAAAEYYHIYKVKTIGDAYLGVAGLPGSESLSGNTALDMLTFASCCAQLFSTRYIHPDNAAVLGTVAKALFGRREPGKRLAVKGADKGAEDPASPPPLTSTPSFIQYGNPSMPSGAVADPEGPGVLCVMRYGVASGPITAGVLQGKTPLFDIWGKTVNLASRMESTGKPGRVQLCESVFQSVVAAKDQPFVFDSRHKVFCKGFGHLSAYFIASCKLPPPKALLVSHSIQPNLGRFFFDTAVPGFQSSSKSGTHNDGSSSGHRSSRSSNISGPGAGAGAGGR